MARSYHHGNLRQALLDATADLVTEKGPSGFSLREVARRAEVSHAAPAHHFGSTQGLLTALALEGFQALNQAMEDAVQGVDDPIDRLRSMGEAYLGVAASRPGHMSIMFRSDLIDIEDEGFSLASYDAYDRLVQALSLVAEAVNPAMDVEMAAKFVWSSVQGLVELAPGFAEIDDRRDVDSPNFDRLFNAFMAFLLDGLRAARF